MKYTADVSFDIDVELVGFPAVSSFESNFASVIYSGIQSAEIEHGSVSPTGVCTDPLEPMDAELREAELPEVPRAISEDLGETSEIVPMEGITDFSTATWTGLERLFLCLPCL